MRFSAAETRAQILEAADEIFYSEGMSALGMERIAARAGVTKKTLYYHFRSKDDLLGAFLDWRHAIVMERYRRWAGKSGTVAERMERMLQKLAAISTDRNWRGCAFLRAALEFADLPGHPARIAAQNSKIVFEDWLRTMLEAEGRAEASILAKTLMVLLDGAIAHVLIHRDPAYADAAARAASELLAVASPRPQIRAA